MSIIRPSTDSELCDRVVEILMDEMGRDTESDQEMNKETEEVKLEQCRQVANEQLDGWRNALNEVVFQVEATTPSTTTVLLSQPVRDSGKQGDESSVRTEIFP